MLATFAALLLFIGILSTSNPTNAQNTYERNMRADSSKWLIYEDFNEEKDRRFEQIIEALSESTFSEDQNSLLLDDLTKYSENPLNINTASAEELQRLNLLAYPQIRNILSYRSKYGPLLSLYELNAVEGLTPEIIQSLLPFISFDQPEDSTRIKNPKLMQKIILRAKTSFPLARGFSSVSETKTAVYTGPPFGLYSRYQLEIPGRLEAGLIADHDAGEEFFKGTNPCGFDYYSGFISWQGKSILRQVTVGDYCLMFGQGVNYWSGSGLGKSDNVINIMRTGQGARPYTSTDENLFFRGAAAVLGKGSMQLTLFYSDKKRDANLISDKNTGETQFTSLKTEGYHRTQSETEDEKVLSERDAGIYGELRLEKFRLGVLYSCQHFGLNMTKGTQVYKAKSFEGNENSNLGIDWQGGFGRLQLFGEAGMSENKKYGISQGIILYAHQRLNVSFLYRYFDPGFHAFYGNPLSEGSEGRNERGFYSGVEIFPAAKIKISGYVDFYHFPWLTYSTIKPENGKDYMVRVDCAFSKKLNIYLRCKFESKPQKFSRDTGNPADYDEILNKFRLHSEWRLADRLFLKNRIEYARYAFNNLNENGFLVYQDLVLSPFRKFDLRFRYAWYNTDGYNSRIYTYENDLLYYFSIPEFHGIGQRIYLSLKWQPVEQITAYFKAGYTLHGNVDSWGSGNDVTKGNSRAEVRAEICIRL
jgi:hypothetical protein